MANKMKWYDWIAYSLITIGALNWGLTAFGFNLVEKFANLFSCHCNPPGSACATFYCATLPNAIPFVIYLIIGIAGLFAVYTAIKLAIKK